MTKHSFQFGSVNNVFRVEHSIHPHKIFIIAHCDHKNSMSTMHKLWMKLNSVIQSS